MKKLLLLVLCTQLQAYDFDFKQIEEDRQRIEASEVTYHFDFQNPKHKYFLVINTLDVATTMYAIENRNTLIEGNAFLPEDPELEELLLHKAIVIYTLNHMGLFSTHPDDQYYLNALNIVLTAAVINNLYRINTND